MYIDAQSTLALYKVNLEFYFHLCDLLRDNTLRWSEAGNRAVDSCTAELETAATRMLDANDWGNLAFVSSDLYWKALQLQTRSVQQLAETTLGNHNAFSAAVQKAVSTWQKDAAGALRETTGAMPISTTLQDYLQDYLHLLSPAESSGRRKSSRGKAH